jgi:hypothetical protein
MANTLNTGTGAGSLANFIPEVWANSALDVLRSQIVLARVITKDSDVATFTQGDVLTVPVPGTFAAQDKAAGTAVTLQNPSANKVTVTLNKHKEVSFIVEDPVRAQANQDTVMRHVRQAAVALAEQIEADVAGLYAGLSGVVGGPGTPASRASLLTIRQTLNDNKAPTAGRFVVVGPAGEVDLLGDNDLKGYFENARPEAVSEGSLGRVFGMDVYMSQLVPTSGAGATGIAGTPEFGILAMRSLPTTGAPGVEQIAMRDAQSGLVIRQTASYDTDLLGIKVTLDVLYGVAEMRDECGVAFAHAKS